jgi:hypothetical protein
MCCEIKVVVNKSVTKLYNLLDLGDKLVNLQGLYKNVLREKLSKLKLYCIRLNKTKIFHGLVCNNENKKSISFKRSF